MDSQLTQACYIRDGFKCRHCKNRNALHPHHVIYRSHGGTDTLDNLLTLCACCHLEGVHGGRLVIEVIETLEDDLIVRFIRKKGWQPAW